MKLRQTVIDLIKRPTKWAKILFDDIGIRDGRIQNSTRSDDLENRIEERRDFQLLAEIITFLKRQHIYLCSKTPNLFSTVEVPGFAI
jgi:hypothetical protein